MDTERTATVVALLGFTAQFPSNNNCAGHTAQVKTDTGASHEG
jgi:hypothetical protein